MRQPIRAGTGAMKGKVIFAGMISSRITTTNESIFL